MASDLNPPFRAVGATEGEIPPGLRTPGGGSPNRSPEEGIVLAKPTPTELSAPINPDRGVEGHRNLFCSFYDGCLDEAVKRSWNSWTCVRCQLFSMQPHVDAGLESYATQRRLG